MRIAFTLTWKVVLGLVAAAGLAALAVGWSGFVSIAASSGHFAPVSWFLHWTMQNAVATQSMGIEVPEDVDLADGSLVQRASGHFATGCAPCHGAPGINQSPVVLSMTPPPPRLEEKVGEWEDRELFWIGQHGVKYSGMPAWVTQERPDEVWAMVAFLRALPTLSAEDYAAMALGGTDARTPPPIGTASRVVSARGETALADCARCHGRDGQGVSASVALGPTAKAFPIIAGQPEAYLIETLKAFASGRRHSGYMQPAARRYDETVLTELAAHYAAQPAAAGGAGEASATAPNPGLPSPGAGADTVRTDGDAAVSAADPRSGAEIGAEVAKPVGRADSPTAPGLPETPVSTGTEPVDLSPDQAASRAAIARVVPAFAAYGPPYDEAGLVDLGRLIATEGLSDRKLPACQSCHGGAERAANAQKNAHYPYLAGQPAWYLSTHLHLWRTHHRAGGPYAHLMDKIAIHLTDQQIAAVSLWYARQPPGR